MALLPHKPSRTIRLAALLILADCLFFGFVNPSVASSGVVIVGCLLLGASLYALSRLLMQFAGVLLPIGVQPQRRLALCVALSVTIMLLLQSVGQLSWRDLFAIVPISIIGYAYWGYAASQKVAR